MPFRSAVASALLAFAVAGGSVARAAGSPPPAAAVPSPGAMLTPALLGKVLRLIDLRGVEREVPPNYANALGMTASGQAWPDRQQAATQGKVLHGFAVSRGTDQDVVISVRDDVELRVFRVRRDGGMVVTACIVDLGDGDITMRAPAEAQAQLDEEMRFWATYVDQLLARPK